MGRKLDANELYCMAEARDAIFSLPRHDSLKSFFEKMDIVLKQMAENGTVDGNPPEYEYFTPTDEDAKNRPTVEVRDYDNFKWNSRTLVYVGGGKFHCISNLGDRFAPWNYCRMKKENKGDQNV